MYAYYPNVSMSNVAPFAAGPQLRPQGFVGDLFGQFGAPAGTALGTIFGNPSLGGQIGGLVGNLGSLIPFSAGPQLQPQSLFGDLGGSLGGSLGGLIGGLFGNSSLGNQIGGTVGGLAGELGGMFLPLSAGPQFSLASAEPKPPQNGASGPKSILLPESAIPTAMKTTMNIQTSLMQGGVPRLVGDLAKTVSEATDISAEAKSELDTLTGRAMDFIEAGDYQKATIQALVGLNTLAVARQRAQVSAAA